MPFLFSVSAFAAFKNNITIVTLYTNLGNDGIIHAINETKVGAIMCSFDTWPKVKSVIGECPSIKKIFLMENQVRETYSNSKPLARTGSQAKETKWRNRT